MGQSDLVSTLTIHSIEEERKREQIHEYTWTGVEGGRRVRSTDSSSTVE